MKIKDNQDKVLMMWAIAKRNEAIDNYRKVAREYCLGRINCEAVEAARKNARYYGASDEMLTAIGTEVMETVTDEELMDAVGE